MITLFAHNLHWMGEDRSLDTEDQCAHGNVEFRVNDAIFVKPEDGDWSVSAAGLYLLRTLEYSHTAEDPANDPVTDNYLFPCCGFNVWLIKGKLAVMGCPNGINVEVVRSGENVTLKKEGVEVTVGSEEWKSAVFSFADQIKEFYRSEAPKKAPEDKLDREGWETFWKEWDVRRSAIN